MNIWHSGADSTPLSVNGVSSLIYTLALQQSLLGHKVTLLLPRSPDQAALQFADRSGVQFLESIPDVAHIQNPAHAPDLVHMHSVFIPNQWRLSRPLSRHRTPYLITPHGGLSPHILARNAWKKAIYSNLFEKNRFYRASAITLVTNAEEAEVRSFVPKFTGLVECVPNAVDIVQLGSAEWKPTSEAPKIVFLGRFDVHHKGLDILLKLAGKLPALEFHLYGHGDFGSPPLSGLLAGKPPNVTFHDPVFGEAKTRVLSEATLYIQTSRWEAFGISIAEAMCIGLPCAIASTLHLATWFREHDLGLVLSEDLTQAASELSSVVARPQLLSNWSKRGRDFARSTFDPQNVAVEYLRVYKQILDV